MAIISSDLSNDQVLICKETRCSKELITVTLMIKNTATI